LPEDVGPCEVILPFNPGIVEGRGIKKGDVLFGLPAAAGCPLVARDRGSEIGNHTPVADEGLVSHSRQKPEIGGLYHFLPGTCMIQSRHSAVVSVLAKRGDALRVRFDRIMIE